MRQNRRTPLTRRPLTARRRMASPEADLEELEHEMADLEGDLDKYIKYEWKVYNDAGPDSPQDFDQWMRFISKLKRASALVARHISLVEANLNAQQALLKQLEY